MELPEDPRVREAIGIAMKSLVRRARLAGEVAIKLRAKGFSEDEIEGALSCLSRSGFINDDKAISSHLQSRTGRRSIGPEKLRAELLQRGATEDQVEGSLALRTDSDDIEAMLAALGGRTWKEGDRSRAGRFLASRGFGEELISTALDRHFGPDAD